MSIPKGSWAAKAAEVLTVGGLRDTEGGERRDSIPAVCGWTSKRESSQSGALVTAGENVRVTSQREDESPGKEA